MTLLKVMYFAHAWHLVKYNKPLVGQNFEAWKHGPVSRVVYEQCKFAKNGIVEEKLLSFNIERKGFFETEYEFDTEINIFLREIFDYYSKFHAFKLSDLTHERGSPWDVIWQRASSRAVPGMTIPNELIRSWFSEHGSLYWTNREQERPT